MLVVVAGIKRRAAPSFCRTFQKTAKVAEAMNVPPAQEMILQEV